MRYLGNYLWVYILASEPKKKMQQYKMLVYNYSYMLKDNFSKA